MQKIVNKIVKYVKSNKIIFVILVILVILGLYYYVNYKREDFDGSATNNVFSKLACIKGTDGNDYIFKIDTSLNMKDSNTNKYYKTLHSLVRNYKKGDTTLNAIKKTDFLESGDTVPCDEANFSTYYVKKLRNPLSKTKSLFNSFSSGWQNQECTVEDIKNESHWCNKVYNSINNDPKLCDTTDPKNNPPKYCMEFKEVNSFANSSNTTRGPIVNNLKVSGRSCPDQCTVKAGKIPTSYKDPVTGNTVCLTDGGLVNGKCVGTPLFTIMNGKVVDNYSKGCKKCASRPSTIEDREAIAAIPDNVWSFNKCLEGCAL
jgi:hypothetical protein